MNKLRYRIVFNKSRGLCMAVAETARSQGKGAAQGAGGPADGTVPAALRLPALRRMAFLLGVTLGGMSATGVSFAQVVADRNAPGQQRPTVLKTANGLIQVNVQTPSAAGVSRNAYSQFDVPAVGVVLNNSRTSVQSQLGGWVEGNPWMTQGTAKVILNEVNSSNPSRLQGYIEVAGARAETVIANPAGIVVDGGGFINVSRATLATGNPRLEDGRLAGYSVQRGQIVVEGVGLDASKTDYTALISRAVQVNAGVWAQRLDIVAGVNDVTPRDTFPAVQARPLADAAPSYAIDVARLGGMYANQVFLVGTEAGVGVRNAGAIGAVAGDLVVTTSGRLENSGSLSASQALQAQATSIGNSGKMQANTALVLRADSLRNAGRIASAADALLTLQGDVDNSHGGIEASRIELTGERLRNSGGSIVQTGASTLGIDAGRMANAGGTLGRQASVTTPDGSGVSGGQSANGAGASPANGNTGPAPTSGASPTAPASAAPVLADGLLHAGVLDNSAGLIAANGVIALHAGAFDNHGGLVYLDSLSVNGPSFDNTGGALTVVRGFSVRTDSFVNDQGKLLIGAGFDAGLGAFSNRQGLVQANQMAIDVVQALDNSRGTLRQLGSADALFTVGRDFAMDHGTLEASAGLHVRAGSISGNGSTINAGADLVVDSGTTSAVLGKWTAGGTVDLHTGDFDNRNGQISAATRLTMHASALANRGGIIAAGTDAAVTAAAIDNEGGTVQAARDLSLAAFGAVGNHAGTIETLAAHSRLDLSGASVVNDGGRIANAGDGKTTVGALSVDNHGFIGGNGAVELTTRTLINGSGATIMSQGDIDMKVGDALTNAGSVGAGGSIRVQQDTGQLDNQGSLVAHGAVMIASASVNNDHGTIATEAGGGGAIAVKAGSLSNRAGAIEADGLASLDIGGAVDNGAGHLRAGANLTLSTGGRIDNGGGSVEAAGRLEMHGGDIGNQGGRISAAGSGASSIVADHGIDSTGLIGANGSLMLAAATLDNGGDIVSAKGDLALAVHRRLANRGGSISAAGALSVNEAGAALVNSGAITAGGTIRLNLDQVDNSGGAIGTLRGAGLLLEANALVNRGGKLMAGADARVQVTGNVDNVDGVLQAAGSLDVRAGGVFGNQGGVVEALGAHGTLALRADALDNTGGHIVNTGDGAAMVSATAHLESSGQIASNGRLDLTAATLHNSGTISAGDGIELAVSKALDNAGTISAAAGLHAEQGAASFRNSGTIVAGSTLALTLKSLDNAGGQLATAKGSHADLILNAQTIGNQGGRLMADRNANIRALDGVDNHAGLVQAGSRLRLEAGGQIDTSAGLIEALAADATLQLHAGSLLNQNGAIVNAGNGETTVQADGTLVNNGRIGANGTLSLEAQSITNAAAGVVTSGGTLALRANARLDNAGSIASRATLSMDQADTALTNRGSMVANGDVAIRAGAIDNDGGTLATTAGSGASLTLQGSSLSNRGGKIVAERALQVGVDAALDNSHGALHGIDTVRVTAGATLSNDGGAIEAAGAGAALALQATSIHNGEGRIINVGTGATTLMATDSLQSQGLVAGNGRLNASAARMDNHAGAMLTSGGAMTLNVGARLDNAGSVSSGAALDVAAAGAAVRNAGRVAAQDTLAVRAGVVDNDGGQLATAKGSGAALRIDAASVSNRAGAIMGDRDVRVSSADGFNNAAGALRAGGSLYVEAAGHVGNDGGAIEALDPAAVLVLHAGALANGGGRIVNVGNGATRITVDGTLSSAGLVAGNGSLALALADLDNRAGGSITAGTKLALEASRGIANAGAIGSHDALTVGAAQATLRNSGQIVGGAGATLNTGAFDNSGGQLTTVKDGGGNIALHAAGVVNVGGAIVADGSIDVTSRAAIDNRAGTVHSNGRLSVDAGAALGNQGGVIEVAGVTATLDMHAASIDNSGGRLVNVGRGATRIDARGDIVTSGTLAGNGTLTVSAASLRNQGVGTLVAGAALDIAVGQGFENTGTTSAAGALTLDEAGARITNGGQIAAGGPMLLHGASIANDGGQIAAQSGASLVLDSESTLSNRAGNIAAGGNAILHARGDYDNRGGQVQSAGPLQVSAGGNLVNKAGALEALGAAGTLNLQAAAIDNTAGRIINAGNGLTTVASASDIVNSGTIAGKGALNIASLTLQNVAGGAIGAGGALELAVSRQLDNAGGTISAGGTLHFDQAGASFGNSGQIGAGGDIGIRAASIANDGGQLYTVNRSGAAIALQAGSLGNAGGTIAADGRLQANVDITIANDAGTLHAGHGASINAGGGLANGSGSIETVDGTLNVAAGSIASGGRIVNAGGGATTLTSASAIVNSGTIAGNGTLDLHANTVQNAGTGTVASGGALLLDVRQQLSNAGTVSSGGVLRFDQAGASFINSGQVASAGETFFNSGSFNNDGGKIATLVGSGAGIRMTASTMSNRGGAILADGDATFVSAAGADNSQGVLHAGGNLALTTSGNVANADGVIEAVGAAGSLDIDAAGINNGTGRIVNLGLGDTRLTAAGGIVNGGVIGAAGSLALSGSTLQNETGGIIAAGGNTTLVIAQQLVNRGKVNSTGRLTFDQAGASFSNSGKVLAGGNVVINARMVDNDGGQLGTGNGSSADLALHTEQLSNQGGRIATDRDLAIITHALTAMGEVFSGRDLALTMDGDFVQGAGAQSLHANRDLSLKVSGTITNTATFGAGGTLRLSGQQIDNQAGATLEGQSVLLNASGNLRNVGEINGANTLAIEAANVGNSGAIVGGNVGIRTGNLDNTGATALVGATGNLGLGVDGTLNNTGGATLYSSGDMAIGARAGGGVGTLNNISSTIEARGSLALDAATLNNIRENVQILHVKTVDETVHMTLPSWYQHGDNHNAYEIGAANYYPHEVYFVNRADILDDHVYVTPDGNTIHRAVIRTHASDSAFFVAGSGLYSAYGAQQRLTLSDGTRVIYYMNGGPAANPDQGGPASNLLSYAPTVTHWSSTVSFSDQYGSCSSDCIRLVTQPGYDDPRTTIIRDTVRALAPVKEKLEVSRDAHHAAVEDQLAPNAGAAAQILARGDMYLTVSGALNNQYGDIKAQGYLAIDGGAAIANTGATLYRNHTFDGTWRSEAGDVVAYQEPSIAEVIGTASGVIQGGQGVSITGRSFGNVDITAGTVGNIRDAVSVIGSGASGAVAVGAHATASADSGVAAGVSASGSVSGNHAGLAGAAGTVGGGSGPGVVQTASASGRNELHADGTVRGSGYSNDVSAGGAVTASGVGNGLSTAGAADGSGIDNGGRLSGAVSNSANLTRLGNVRTGGDAAAVRQTAGVQGTALGSVVKISPSGLFIRNPDPNGSYVYEARSQFADQQQWTSSDYLLKQLAKDPAVTQKRLGDGFYEQQLVREQLSELTGHAAGSGASDDAMYKQLLSNAASAAQAFGLRPGVALSADQVSRLTSDIVWMVSETVMLPDGSTQTVLVPQVYLAHIGDHAVQPGGALVTGNGVSINVTGNIANQGGVIDGGNGRTLLVAGQDIVNKGGTIKGGAVALAAGNDIKNESLTVKQTYDFGQNSGSNTALSNVASIAATGTLDVMAGRDLGDLAGKISAGSATLSAGRDISFNTLQTGSTYQSQIGGYVESDSTLTHQLSHISTSGDLKIAAVGNLNLTGTQVTIGTAGSGSGQLLAGGAINIASVTDEVKTSVQNAPRTAADAFKSALHVDPASGQYDKQIHDNQTVVGAGVNASDALVVSAGLGGSGSLHVGGSSVSAGGSLALAAADSVNIASVQENHLSDTASIRTSSSTFKSRTTEQADYVASSDAVASTVSGKTVDIRAGKDISVVGSAIAGDGNVTLAAAGSVTIGAATSTLAEQHHTQVTDSGFLGGGGFGLSYGTKTTTTDQQRDATTQSGQSRSMVGSLGGSLTIVAGDAIKVSGSDVAAGLDLNLAGRSVTIDPGQDNTKGTFEQKTVQDALTLAVGGSVVNAIQTYQGMRSAASQSKDTRVQALAAATTAMAAKNAADDIARNGVNVSVSLTVGHSESDFTQRTSNLQNSGSTLKAGNDISISASGGGKDSNIDVIGSSLAAQGNVALKADNKVNLLAAQDLESQHSDSKSMSAAAGIGASIGTQGMSYGVTGSASLSRGTQDGSGTTQLNTHVTAGQALVIDSGGDTNIKGAVASGNQVLANVGGNLNIESLQDTAKFDSKSQSLSVSGTVGVGASVSGSISQSKASSDYASVQEQSGIRAGEGGFQVTVGGNTDLKGGVISSSATGGGASSLRTATLTSSDIQNKATSSASSIGVSGGATVAGSTGDAAAKDQGSAHLTDLGPSRADVGLPGATAASSNESGTTRSGIGAGTIVIKDDAGQRALTGQGAAQAVAGVNRNVVTGSDTSGRIGNSFNANSIQAGLSVASAFSSSVAPLVANVVGDIGKAKQDTAQRAADAYTQLATEANQRGDLDGAKALEAKAKESQATADHWGDNGMDRIGLHAVAQGLIGGLTSGGGGGALSNVSGVVGGNLGQQLGETLGKEEAERQGLQGEARAALINDYQHTLAKVGGAVGGLAVSTLGGTGGQEGLIGVAQAANAANVVDLFNRQLHESEAQKLAALKQGKSTAAQHKLDAAACALAHCADGVPTSDPLYAVLKSLQTEGQGYNAEQTVLKATGEFVYQPYLDRTRDALTSQGEWIRRTGGAVNLVMGSVGTIGGVVIAGGGFVSCAETVGLGCGVGTLGTYIAFTSHQQAHEGSQALFGQFQSSEGQRVLNSFNVQTFPGERDPLVNAGLDGVKLVATAAMGKLIPKGLAAAEGFLGGESSAGAKASIGSASTKTGTSPAILEDFYRDGAPPQLMQQTFDQAAVSSTHNVGSTEVILGKYIKGSSYSYDEVARARGATYFSMGDWSTVESQLGAEQMWNVNKAFLDQQIKQGKTFLFTNNPMSESAGYYTKLEFMHLNNNGYTIERDGRFYRAVKK